MGIILFFISSIGVILFVKKKETKKYFNKFSEFFGILIIFLLINNLVDYLLFRNKIYFINVLLSVLGLALDMFLGSVGMYYYKCLGIDASPIFYHQRYSKQIILKFIKDTSTVLLIFFVISATMLFAYTGQIFKDNIFSKFNPTPLISLFIISLDEETFIRLFLLGTILYLFKKFSINQISAIIFTSLFWSLSHISFTDFHIVKFIQINVFGVVLGYYMIKSGWETCFTAHGIYNIFAWLFLRNF